MDKITYLAELAEGLARWVPERERQDILRYYAEYFEEAGFEREAEVVAELGDPWALSCRLAVEGGYVTQDAANAWRPPQKKKRVWPVVVACSLAAAFVGALVIPGAAYVGRTVGRLVNRVVDNPSYGGTAVIEQAEIIDSIPDEYSYFWDETVGGFWCMEDGSLDWFAEIDAKIGIGDIMVTGGEDYALFISTNSDMSSYALDWEVKNGVLKIRDGSADDDFGLDGLGALTEGGTAVNVSITVPYGEPLAKLTVKTGVGNVYLSELYVEDVVSAESETGDMECYEVQAGNKLKLTADVGNIILGIENLDAYAGMEMELEADVGQVEASLGCWEVECSYEVKADVGTVTVNGRDCGTKAEHKVNDAFCKLDIESDVGDVNVWFYNDQWNH